MWTDYYMNIPFCMNGTCRESGLDCWTLVTLIYKERLGIELELFRGLYTDNERETIERIAEAVEIESLKWQQVFAPKEYDVVLMRMFGTIVCHVGVVVDASKFIHILPGGEVTVERLDSFKWAKRIVRFCRYA